MAAVKWSKTHLYFSYQLWNVLAASCLTDVRIKHKFISVGNNCTCFFQHLRWTICSLTQQSLVLKQNELICTNVNSFSQWAWRSANISSLVCSYNMTRALAQIIYLQELQQCYFQVSTFRGQATLGFCISVFTLTVWRSYMFIFVEQENNLWNSISQQPHCCEFPCTVMFINFCDIKIKKAGTSVTCQAGSVY